MASVSVSGGSKVGKQIQDSQSGIVISSKKAAVTHSRSSVTLEMDSFVPAKPHRWREGSDERGRLDGYEMAITVRNEVNTRFDMAKSQEADVMGIKGQKTSKVQTLSTVSKYKKYWDKNNEF